MNWSAVLHFGVIFIVAMLLAGLQTTFWYQVFGNFTPPLLWLIVFTYVAVYRDGVQALFQLMILALVLSSFSAVSLKFFYPGLLVYFLAIHFVKNRIFWNGPGYFLLVCAVGSVAYHGIFIFLEHVIEKSQGEFLWLTRLTQILLTPVFVFPIYWMLSAIDSMFIHSDFKADLGDSTYE